MSLPHFAVKRPVTILMVIAVVLVLGFVSLSQLPIDLLPDIEAPVLAVITNYTNAGPYEVENLVSRPIEETLNTVTNVKSVSSISNRGSSIVIAEFDWGIDMDFASLDVRERVDLVRSFLPEDAGNPTIVKFDPAAMPIMELVITGDVPLYELRELADTTVKNQLERVEGVASVSVTGGQLREIKIDLHPGLLQTYGISVDLIGQLLAAGNLSLPAGTVIDDDLTYLVRTTGEFSDVDQIRNLRIPTATGSYVPLRDIAEVTDGYQEVTELSRFNGQPSVMLSIQKEASGNSVQVAAAVREVLTELNNTLGSGIGLEIAQDMSQFITFSIDNVVNNAVVGALLAVVILLIFLQSIRSTLVIGIAIPVSIIATFVLMYFSNTTANMISLGGLALGVGLLVDNGIVVLENIFRLREQGNDAVTAAVSGTEQVGTAISASTFTTVAVFIPVVFMSGIAAEIFRDMVLTISFSLVVSLVVALTLVPMLSSRLLGKVQAVPVKENRIKATISRVLEKLEVIYKRVLELALRRRGVTVGIVVAFFVIAVVVLLNIGMEFLPSMDQGEIQVRVDLPRGSQLEDTNHVVTLIEEYISDHPDVALVYSAVGGGGIGSSMDFGVGLSSGTSYQGTIGINLVPYQQRQYGTDQVVSHLRDYVSRIQGASITVESVDLTSMLMGATPVQLDVRGNDLDELLAYSNQVEQVISQIPGLVEVSNSMTESEPEIRVIIDRDKASDYGLTVGQIASHLRTLMSGTTVTRLRTEGQEIDIVVQLDEDWRQSPDDLEDILITTPRGTIPLGEVISLQKGESPLSVNRTEGSRVITVTGQLDGRDLNSVNREVETLLEDLPPPHGIDISFGGEDQQMVEAFDQLQLALALGVLLVFMVLAAQFESLVQPFIIMFTLPLSLIGIVLGTVLFKLNFSVVSFIGVIMLAGIVVNNGIILIDYINQLREAGNSRQQAVVEGGTTRLRPILMTTLTTVLAMLPMVLVTGDGAELQRPIAVTVVGGLSTSMLMTLFIIPLIYTYVDDFGLWVNKLFKRQKNTSMEG